MATSTTTAVELHQLPLQTHASGHNRFHIESNRESQNSSSDDVLEASRLADSAVPDGGYGWVVIGACAVISWWVSTRLDLKCDTWLRMEYGIDTNAFILVCGDGL